MQNASHHWRGGAAVTQARVAAPFAPMPASPALEKLFVPGKDRIVSAVRKLPGRDAE